MSLMELFSNYTPKTTHYEPATEKGNHGNQADYALVTSGGLINTAGNQGNHGNHENSINKMDAEESYFEFLVMPPPPGTPIIASVLPHASLAEIKKIFKSAESIMPIPVDEKEISPLRPDDRRKILSWLSHIDETKGSLPWTILPTVLHCNGFGIDSGMGLDAAFLAES